MSRGEVSRARTISRDPDLAQKTRMRRCSGRGMSQGLAMRGAANRVASLGAVKGIRPAMIRGESDGDLNPVAVLRDVTRRARG